MTSIEWNKRRDFRVQAARDEVLAMFGEWDFSRPETQALYAILMRLYAAGCNEQREKNARRRKQRLLCKQSTPEEVEAMRADCARPFDPAKALDARAVRR